MKVFRFGPIALTTTLTTNLLNPATATGGTNGGSSAQFIVLHHLRIANKTAAVATVSLWLGATGANTAGTEIITGKRVPANDWIELSFPSGLRLDSSDFLVGGSGTATALSIQGSGYVGVAG